MARYFGLLLTLFVAGAAADSRCVSTGEAVIFTQGQGFLEAKLTRVAGDREHTCGLLTGKVYRIYYSATAIRDSTRRSYMSRAGRLLINKPAGYRFRFVYSLSEADAVVDALWQVEPQ